MKLYELKFYDGQPLEKGGTSIQGDAAPAIKALYGKVFTDDMAILDYGAGKYARNADFFRKKGIRTFAFDPFNSNAPEAEGWDEGKVADHVSAKTNGGKKFDAAFTCFVLNVVPKKVEADIIRAVERLGKKTVHITRNNDVFVSTKNALLKKDKYVYPFFVNEYNGGKEVDPATLSDDAIMEFCKFGVQTSRGFQRIPDLEEYGYKLIRKTDGFKVYEK